MCLNINFLKFPNILQFEVRLKIADDRTCLHCPYRVPVRIGISLNCEMKKEINKFSELGRSQRYLEMYRVY